MKTAFAVFGIIGICLSSMGTYAASVKGNYNNTNNTYVPSTNGLRGNAGALEVYKQNQRNTYFLITQPDVDTACREKIFACLTEYCGDTTVVPGQMYSKCQYATESDLYNYTLLCLQRDTSVLLPQYNTNNRTGAGGMNTAARLCPSYVQQELLSFLSMSNMATQLSKSHSDLCIKRRQELEAATSCHSVALSYGTETASKLNSKLNEYCGPGIPGGSSEMVTRFEIAGNTGANVWDWAEKIVSLDMNKKSDTWRADVDAVLANYANRMNLACGDNFQINTTFNATSGVSTNKKSNLQTVLALATGLNQDNQPPVVENPYETQSLYKEFVTKNEMWTYKEAWQVVSAAISNSALTQNSWLTTAQVDDMKTAYIRGTKVFIMRDSGRCYIIPVAETTPAETSIIAQKFASCVSK